MLFKRLTLKIIFNLMKKKVSLKDIAQKVGVSIALVSYVLNNQKLNRINKAVAQKIKDTALELNYRTNQIARSLKTNRTNTIGLIVADISNPFSGSLARIIEDEAEKHGHTVIFGSSDEDSDRCKKVMNVLINHQVDGLIVVPTSRAEEQLNLLTETEIPFVLLDRYFPGLNVNYIAIDNYSAAYALTKHLIEQGRKRIGIITFESDLFNLQERLRGFTTCLEDHSLNNDPERIKKVSMNLEAKSVEHAMRVMLLQPEPIDAIVFTANTISLLGLKYLKTLPLKVPDDLAIVAFDETDAADLFYAPLTHIKQPLKQMGKLAVDTLMDCINNQNKVVQINLEAELIIRNSSVI